MSIDEFAERVQSCSEWISACDDDSQLADAQTLLGALDDTLWKRVRRREPLIVMLRESLTNAAEIVDQLDDDDLYTARELAQGLVEHIQQITARGPRDMPMDPPDEGIYPPRNITHDPSWGPVPSEPAPLPPEDFDYDPNAER